VQISPHVYLVGSEQFGLSHPLDCNCYLVDGGSEIALIDTGIGLGVEEIWSNIQHDGFDPHKLNHILITHSHNGHWGGAEELRRRTGAVVWAHRDAAPRMADISNDPGIRTNIRFGRYPNGYEPRPCRADAVFNDNLRVGNIVVSIILVQGHTKDAVCFLFEDAGKRALATGDTVFYGGKIGLINLEGCTFEDYRRDIHKLENLNIDMLLPGHGVFTLNRGQRHINRAITKLSDFVLPETFFEMNELVWDRDYLKLMTAGGQTS
jgi:glyoxylase-like metal-dependent hydrolase (beta-lactamase superfamily II)